MTKSEIDLLRRALELLRRVVPDSDEICAVDSPRRCPVTKFAKKFLARDSDSDVTSAELWQFYSELVAGRELEAVTKSVFLRSLSGTLEATFGVKKSHSVMRNGHRQRGFRGINLSAQA